MPPRATIWDYVRQVAFKRKITFLEIGACDGTETRKFLLALQAQGRYDFTFFCFEPDPRHVEMLRLIAGENRFVPKAVGALNGPVPFWQSYGIGDELYYGSSSIRKPKRVLDAWPMMKFHETECESVTIDAFCEEKGIKHIDFIWADVQGAELDLIVGASQMLENTDYFYTEYCDGELYEGELPLDRIQEQLPRFKMIEKWEGDALFRRKGVRSMKFPWTPK
jgi:FkbM family methyltransferase